ncbi:ABC transporter substrate-binding protein [Knoellia sp. 3-2P3]|uniref:ABC transporter substrate-binding protein n=1 Tax=unclassified Knoellia TaxID=2618719 RepID=UPI0023DACEDF|nr:ABC transporter substrate-binding protein [Knoellia sp. 3-2P3]MDF2093381.1 ABC transporter substrate-binding protein [Knoellia sp. 3-2P3]
MRSTRRLLGAVGALVAPALAAGCSAVSFDQAGGTDEGTLTAVSLGPAATWDPQRMTSQKDMAFAGRVFMRTLTAFPAGADAAEQSRLVGDLATDTGRPSKDLRTWSFTLRDGVSWQDGSPVTCEDVRYGVARSFAEPIATEGLNYPLAALDLPRKADGSATYRGPWSGGGGSGAKAFDKAVSCKGRTITFRLTEPRADFSQMVSLAPFAPYKKSADKREASKHAVFSNGPYLLKGGWDEGTGGTFERNPHWQQASDPVRRPTAARIRYQEGVEAQTATQHIMADDDENRRAVALDSAPPAMQHSITSSDGLRSRSVNPRLALVDYLAVNVARGPLTKAEARQALAVATNREGYVTALGGPTAATPAYSVVGGAVPEHPGSDLLEAGPRGNTAVARALLRDSGLTLPVRLRVAYRSTPTADKAMAALENGWEAAGFDIALQPVEKDYFAAVSSPGRTRESEVIWANWAADWPSASTVLPPLFDSRINLSAAGSGRDYGRFSDDKANARMTEIQGVRDRTRREQAWAELDSSLVRAGVYVPLVQHRALFTAGSEVTGLAANEALGGWVDLARVGVR